MPENRFNSVEEESGGAASVDNKSNPSGSKIISNLINLGVSSAAEAFGLTDPQIQKVGYQGGIPTFTSRRQRVPYTDDPTRRPGSSGQRYFTDVGFSRTPENTSTLAAQNILNPVREDVREKPPALGGIGNISTFAEFDKLTSPELQNEKSGIAQELLRLRGDENTYFGPQPNKDGWTPPPDGAIVTQAIEGWRNTKTGETYTTNTGGWTPPSDDWVRDNSGAALKTMAAGGIAQLNPRYFAGATDGMADLLPANIDGQQEARLSDGEFVMPADVVSHLGNGNSNAGADVLYDMMDRVRKARTGTEQQGRQINPNNMLPV